MGLENSGTMSIGGSTAGRSINLELGRSATASSNLGESALRDLADVSSGAISISNFYGKSSLPAGASDYITGIGTMGSTQTLTLNSSTNLNLGSSGAALTMIDIDGNTASYTPQTSTIASVASVENWSPGTQSWGGYWSSSQIRRYLFSPAIAVTELRTDGSGTGSYGRLLKASYNGNMYQNAPQSGTITGTQYNGDQDWNALWGTSSHGPQNQSGTFYQINFSTSWLLDELWVVETSSWSADAVSINGDRLTNSQYLPVLTFSSSNNQDLKFFKAGDVVQTGVNVLSTNTTANTMKVTGGIWEGSNGTAFGTWNQSRTWSNSLSNFSNGSNIFDNNFTNGANTPGGGGTGTFNISSNTLSYSSKVEVYANSPGTTLYIRLNGTTVYQGSGGGTWITIATGSGTISRIDVNCDWFDATLRGIKVDGVPLVDSGVSGGPSGETSVTGPSKSGTGNFSSSSSNTVTVSSSNSEWISDDNRLGTEHYIKLV